MKIIIGGDKKSIKIKERIKNEIKDHNIHDIGLFYENENKNDIYISDMISTKLILYDIGILISENPINMAKNSNKYSIVKCSICQSKESAILAREKFNANMISIGLNTKDDVVDIIKTFINTK